MNHLPVGAAVRYFMQLMGQPAPDVPTQPGQEILTEDRWELRLALIDEEYDELHQAYNVGDHAAFLDACVDMVYVIVGTAVEAGLPFDEAFAAVHSANMMKRDKDGKVRYDDNGKVVKPEGWTPPDIKALLR